MLRNKNWTKLGLKNRFFIIFLFARFSLKSHSPYRKKKIVETKNQVLTQKRLFLDQDLTLQHMLHTHVYAYVHTPRKVQKGFLATKRSGRNRSVFPKNLFKQTKTSNVILIS